MNSSTVILVENLSKAYRLGQIGTGTFTYDLAVWWAKMRGKPNPMLRIGDADYGNRDGEELWALRSVSFTVQQGEVLGIIGRNGAGKSTLLKILSRVTAPTSGKVKVKGRIASLLEVGTGFHPELTGRENIYLNGAILGMNRKEILHKFDEIVDFAEVENFIDTPVKRYSSGMYVRLAFAVAAHLDPEILVVDEVLAVGDAEFQQKCIGKMGDVAHEGRTVLFVSHNMSAISKLCNNCALIKNGKLDRVGPTNLVVADYLNQSSRNLTNINLNDYPFRKGHQGVYFQWANIGNKNGETNKFSIGDDIIIKFKLNSKLLYLGQQVRLSVALRSSDGIALVHMVDEDSHFKIKSIRQEEIVEVVMSDIRFYPDEYHLSLYVGSITSSECYDYVEDCLSFVINDGGVLTSRRLPISAGRMLLTPIWKRGD